MNITEEEKELKDYYYSNPPESYEKDHGFPYDRMTPNAFEDITYFLIKQHIQHESEWNGFDEVKSLGGVRDNGRDCLLKKEGLTRAIIQCKRFEKKDKLTKPSFVQEIIKFLLYSIKEPSLIGSPEGFTYYILSSSGLTSDTKKLINNFSSQILNESKLEVWVNTVINNYSTIKDLGNYSTCKNELDKLIVAIDVKELKTKDFDVLLEKPKNLNIQNAFFSIKKVIDTDSFKKILDNKFDTKIKYNDAVNYIKSASFDFKNLKNTFGNNADTHIDRIETNQIFDWVLSDLSEKNKNLAVVIAKAGYGKTTIIKDLYDKLIEKEFPVLAIKSDKYYSEDRVSLERKIFQENEISIKNVITSILENNQKIIVLIDQLDALSQTLSSRRDYLLTYNRLIDNLSSFPNVRVIISVRSYDLNYDSDLSIYKNTELYNHFNVKKLGTNQVKSVLSKFNTNSINEKFIELLRVPSHLELYCKLRGKSQLDVDALKTVYDLQNALWDELINDSKPLNLNTKQLLFLIANKMYELQNITISNLFNDEFKEELNYLRSRDIIFEDNNGLQFFHQTFYDFTFSKQFVENGKSIIKYIKKEGQGLIIRQTIKMVFEYLREYNPESYIYNLKKLIGSKKYRFHIKMLLITSLAYIDSPLRDEKEVFLKIIYKKSTYFDLFMSSVNSTGWVKFLINQTFFSKIFESKPSFLENFYKKLNFKKIPEKLRINRAYRENAINQCLRNNINSSSSIISSYLVSLPEKTTTNGSIQFLLSDVKKWDDNFLKLFESNFSFQKESNTKRDNFWFYEILINISINYPEYSLSKIEPAFNELFYADHWSLPHLDHSLEKFLESLFKNHSDIAFNFFFNLAKKVTLETKINNEYQTYGLIIKSNLFSESRGGRRSPDMVDGQVYGFIEEYLHNLILKDIKKVEKFLQDNLTSDLYTVLRLCVSCMKIKPKYFNNQIFKLIVIINDKKGFLTFDDILQFDLRKLIEKSFEYFSDEQKEMIINIIFTIRRPHEFKSWKYEGKKYHNLSSQGKKQFLFIQAIPQNEIMKISRLRKRYQEFVRKYGLLKDNEPSDSRGVSITSGAIHPISNQSLEYMSLDNWRKSMLKYGNNFRERPESRKGGTRELASDFNQTVNNNPERFYSFIDSLINERIVSDDYIIQGYRGLFESQYDAKKVYLLYRKIMKFDNLDVSNLISFLYSTDYLIKNKLLDNNVLSFLSSLALNHPNPEKPLNPENPEFDVNQTVRSVAIGLIIDSFNYKQFLDEIFNTVEKVSTDEQISVRISVITKLAYLKNLDIDRSFKIFEQMVQTNDVELLNLSFWSADYFKYEKFEKMLPYFNRIVENTELHEKGSVIIAKAFIENREYKGSYELLNRLASQSEIAVCQILHVAEENLYYENNFSQECYDLLLKFLKVNGDDIASRYSGFILRKFKLDNFDIAYPFLVEYIKSSHCEKEPRYFFNYLIECSKKHPLKCLQLFKKTMHFGNSDVQKRSYLRDEPIKVILAIYNSLKKNNHKKSYINQALDLLDIILKDQRYRLDASKAIDSI